MSIKEVLKEKIEAHRPRTQTLVRKHGDVKVGEVTIAQAIGGARGVRCLVTDISYLDPMEGIRFWSSGSDFARADHQGAASG